MSAASSKQVDFILVLAGKLQGREVRYLTEVEGLTRRQKTGGMTASEASQLIDEMKKEVARGGAALRRMVDAASDVEVRQVAVSARQTGASKAAVARAAGVTSHTVSRWVDEMPAIQALHDAAEDHAAAEAAMEQAREAMETAAAGLARARSARHEAAAAARAAGVSFTAAARILGVTPTTVSVWTQKEAPPTR